MKSDVDDITGSSQDRDSDVKFLLDVSWRQASKIRCLGKSTMILVEYLMMTNKEENAA